MKKKTLFYRHVYCGNFWTLTQLTLCGVPTIKMKSHSAVLPIYSVCPLSELIYIRRHFLGILNIETFEYIPTILE
jgi:hypothetical protein